ncbi:hypothetical protein H6F76_22615 [Leptolyngbya sp. FACHB-321]|uniref:hypothetical protein n=1 Tax=Leptolyngbya sp. FACHB-321 TaxID=2692807 RepID=UPI001688F98C|nr:hypothetical protein [Leptolyngbya sp. FACHB-321]MBD2037751.1 hypothetical protein [Leptolyngbya sp. FACHB-321]
MSKAMQTAFLAALHEKAPKLSGSSGTQLAARKSDHQALVRLETTASSHLRRQYSIAPEDEAR